jgi:hypothetical protein
MLRYETSLLFAEIMLGRSNEDLAAMSAISTTKNFIHAGSSLVVVVVGLLSLIVLGRVQAGVNALMQMSSSAAGAETGSNVGPTR